MMLEHVLVLSAYLFSIGIYGMIMSRNMDIALMCLELILNAVNMNFKYFLNFVMAITLAEAAIGLTIVSSIYHNRKSTCINQSNLLNK
ncbi:NdhE [Pyrus ussuriensis x Pyrus communis]|uniref:NdhE(Chloroplast) n=1 Tax=Pyrus ussuriensis x Pyrus communis TaxID=2448454 RepID=A0A5N5GPR3_9ROSA|nr:NdhE [Pyrus ussuriensis x Pyrus communis]